MPAMVASLVPITPRSRALLFAASLLAVGCKGDGDDANADASATATEGTASASASASMSASASASATATDGSASDTDTGETDTDTGGEALDPGRITLHRLNRVEYNNTVRDLLWTEQTPADDFAADDVSLGFDNIADVLTLSPLQAELYERAAESLIDEAMAIAVLEPTVTKREAEGMEVMATIGGANGEFWNLWSNGQITTNVQVETAGDYLFEVRAYGQQAGPDLPHMVLSMDGAMVAEFDVDAINTGPKVYAVTVPVEPGVHIFAAEFTNDFYDQDMMLDRNLLVDWLQVSGPQDLPGEPNKQRERIMICDPVTDGEDACGRLILRTFGRRALRRPLTDAEVDRLMLFISDAKAEGGTFDDGLKLALRAILVSPHFIFRVEIDPNPTSLTPHPLSDFEFATRLSYFLWSSMPDDELLELAEKGLLGDPKVVSEQTLRMLEDPRASALVDNFAGQWFLIRAVSDAFHDEQTFPAWTDELRAAMIEEMRLFTGSIFTGERSMIELMTAKESYLNEVLAAHYGVEGVQGEAFAPVSLDGVPRQGILTQAGLLSVLSHADHTSVVKRGKYLMESILCLSPQPPPDDLDIPPLPPPMPGATQREILEEHRKNPICAGCHDVMDPLGFGLENYDAIGAYRLLDNGVEIDASGNLPSGATFTDAVGMTTLLAQEPDFIECMVRKTFIYGLGRSVTIADYPYLDEIIADFSASEYQFDELVTSLVLSEAFRMRRGEPE